MKKKSLIKDKRQGADAPQSLEPQKAYHKEVNLNFEFWWFQYPATRNFSWTNIIAQRYDCMIFKDGRGMSYSLPDPHTTVLFDNKSLCVYNLGV